MADTQTTGWQKVTVLSGALAAVLIPVVLAVIGFMTSTALKDREVHGKFVELAVTILQEPPMPENRSVRKWAIEVLGRYSGVPLEGEAEATLQERTVLPALPAAAGAASVDRASAAALEREGFQALVAGHVEAAIAAFEAAEEAYPSYHAVYDIARLLRANRARWDDSTARREVLSTIVTRYAWKPPEELLQELKRQVEP